MKLSNPAARASAKAWLGTWPATAALLALAIFSCYGVLFWTPFIYDDVLFLSNNKLVYGPWPGWGKIMFSSFGVAKGEYGPLSTLLPWAIYRFPGSTVELLRLTSLLMHLANSLLLALLYRRWLGTPLKALAASLLFALYPAHVEVLAISTFNKHLGVAFFGLLLLEAKTAERAPSWRRLQAWASLCGGLLWKESALMLAPLALAVDACSRQPRRTLRREAPLSAGLWAIAAAYVGWRMLALPRQYQPIPEPTLLCHALTAGKMLGWYFRQLAWPGSLCLEHSLRPVTAALGWEAFAIVSGCCAGAFALLWTYRRDRTAGLGLIWALLFLAPFLNIVPYLNYSLVTDRYLYFCSAGFILAAARLCTCLGGARRAVAGLASVVLLCVLYFARGMSHAAQFANPVTLWLMTSRCAPSNPRAHAVLGWLLFRLRLNQQGEQELQSALRIDPVYLEAIESLTMLYAETGRTHEAIRYALRRVSLLPDSTGLQNIGALLLRGGRIREATSYLERAVNLDSTDQDAVLNLGECYLQLGRSEEARALVVPLAADKRLGARAFWLLGRIAMAEGRRPQGELLWRHSLQINPLRREELGELARLYAREGRPGEIRRLYALALAALDALSGRLEVKDLRRQVERDRDELLAGNRRRPG